MNTEEFFTQGNESNYRTENTAIQLKETVVVPVIEEQLTVNKKTIVTGKIEIKKEVEEAEEILNMSMLNDEYNIERFPVNNYVETAPQVRQEGDTMIISVVKEVIVKRLLLTEEIRITKRTTSTTEQYKALLRKEKVTITHTPQQEE